MTDTAIVRCGEIGTKSNTVQKQLIQTLRQRIEERIRHEGLKYDKVSTRQGRIVAHTEQAEKTAEILKRVPYVKTVSPAEKTEPEIEPIKKASKNFDYGETFGVDPNKGNTELSTPEIAEEIGSHVKEFTGAEVDLDEPDTWLGVDVREDEA
jgi:adenylyl- and sulfurtransferase ThiI